MTLLYTQGRKVHGRSIKSCADEEDDDDDDKRRRRRAEDPFTQWQEYYKDRLNVNLVPLPPHRVSGITYHRRNLLRGFRLDFTGTSEDEQTVRRDTFCGLARRWVLQFVAQEERFRIEELVVDGDDARAVALGAESERGED